MNNASYQSPNHAYGYNIGLYNTLIVCIQPLVALGTLAGSFKVWVGVTLIVCLPKEFPHFPQRVI